MMSRRFVHPPYVPDDEEAPVDYEQFVAAEVAMAKKRLGVLAVASSHHGERVHRGKGQATSLEDSMVSTYTHYHRESMKKPKAPGRREVVIDVSALLPPGWTPQTPVSPTITPRSPRSKARGRSRPHPAAKHRQPISLQAGSISSAEESLYSLHSQPSQHSQHSRLAQHSDALATAPAAAEALEAHSEAATRYLAEKKESFKLLMAFLSAALYVKTLRAQAHARFHIESSAATVVQRWYRHLADVFRIKNFFANMRWPLKIIVQVRCWRKRKAADKVLSMLRDLESSSKFVQIKKALGKIRHAQLVVKSFVQVCLARVEMLTRLWVREETRVRKLLLAQDRRREAALKRAAMKRNLEREASRKGHYNIHTIWAQRKEAVGLLVAHCDVVQQSYHKNAVAGDRARTRASGWRRREQEQPQESRQNQQDQQAQQERQVEGGGGERAEGPSTDHDNGLDVHPTTDGAEAEHDVDAEAFVSPREREDAIRRTMMSRRRIHVRLQERVAEKKKEHHVSEAQCRAFLLTPRADDAAALEVIDNILLGAEAAHEEETPAPPLTAQNDLFLCLTDPRLGPSWPKIIRDHVERDVRRKNQSPAAVVLD